MELQNLVPDAELCKELKENGYSQSSLFVWTKDYADTGYYVTNNPTTHAGEAGWNIAAPTIAEIGEQLPKINNLNGYTYRLTMIWGTPSVALLYNATGTDVDLYEHIYGMSEVEVLARMWLYLKKNGYIKLEELGTK